VDSHLASARLHAQPSSGRLEGHGFMEPSQITIAITVYNRREYLKQDIASALDGPVPWKPVQVGLHSQDAKRPRARTCKRKYSRDRSFKQPSGRASQTGILRAPKNISQCP